MFKEYAEHETNPERSNGFFEGMNYKAKVDQRKYISPDDLYQFRVHREADREGEFEFGIVPLGLLLSVSGD